MSKRHQASRRRAYGRRQHELHERPEARRADPYLDADDEPQPLVSLATTPADRPRQGLIFRFAD